MSRRKTMTFDGPGVGVNRASASHDGARGTRSRSGRGGLSLRLRLIAAVAVPLVLSACAREVATAVKPAAPGFFFGVWHGFIFPLSWVGSLFSSDIAIYAVPNNGGWYDFGYFVGIVFLGVGTRKSTTVYRDRVVYRDRGPTIEGERVD